MQEQQELPLACAPLSTSLDDGYHNYFPFELNSFPIPIIDNLEACQIFVVQVVTTDCLFD